MKLRPFKRQPFSALVVVLTLGLGLGSLGVVSALVSAVLFPRPPFTEPERTVVLWASTKPGATQRADYLTAQRVDKWQAAPPRSLVGVSAFGSTAGLLRVESTTHRFTYTAVSDSFFNTLGIHNARGRLLEPHDGAPDAPRAVVLSDRAWRKYFHGDRAAIGSSVSIDSVFYTVVGIAPAEMNIPQGAEAWVMRAHVPARKLPVAWLMVGRLRADIDEAFAQGEIVARSRAEHQTDSIAYAGQGVTAVNLANNERRLGQGLLPLMAMSLAALYIIAALNLSILLLMQVGSRSHELAIRSALGSGSWGAMRPVLAEIALQFALGGALALLTSLAALRVIRNRFLFGQAPLTGRAELVVVIAITVLAVGTLALVIPLVVRWAGKTDLLSTLRRGSQSVTSDRRSQQIRRFLVAAEMALAVVLACAAGIVGKALHRFRSVDLGYDSQQVVMARPDYRSLHHGHDQQVVLAEAVRSRLQGAGGIAEASYWRRVPRPWPPLPQERVFAIEGRVKVTPDLYQYYEVGPRFLETLGAPLVEGRNFDVRDQRGALPVAIVNRIAAASWWPGQSAIGKRVSLNPTNSAAWLTIVGVADVVGLDPTFDRTLIARQRARPQLFVPVVQAGPGETPFWHWASDCFICPQIAIGARSSAGAGAARGDLQNSIRALEPNLPVNTPRTLYDEQVTEYTGETLRTAVRVAGGLAAISCLIAMLGVYGVVAAGVAARVKELAIRQALGAGRWRLLQMMFRENVSLAVLAVAAGGCLYVAVERLAWPVIFGNNRYLLFNVSAIDIRVIVPMLLAGLVIVLIAVAAGSRRALWLDPREGLKA